MTDVEKLKREIAELKERTEFLLETCEGLTARLAGADAICVLLAAGQPLAASEIASALDLTRLAQDFGPNHPMYEGAFAHAREMASIASEIRGREPV